MEDGLQVWMEMPTDYVPGIGDEVRYQRLDTREGHEGSQFYLRWPMGRKVAKGHVGLTLDEFHGIVKGEPQISSEAPGQLTAGGNNGNKKGPLSLFKRSS
jgi:hypothetical protein